MVDEVDTVPGDEAVGVRWFLSELSMTASKTNASNAEDSMDAVTQLPEVHTLNRSSLGCKSQRHG